MCSRYFQYLRNVENIRKLLKKLYAIIRNKHLTTGKLSYVIRSVIIFFKNSIYRFVQTLNSEIIPFVFGKKYFCMKRKFFIQEIGVISSGNLPRIIILASPIGCSSGNRSENKFGSSIAEFLF